MFPGLPGDLELFTVEEVAKLKELGVLNPLDVPGHLPLFLPLVSSSQGKVVSAALGVPPPDLDTQEIGHSLAVDQDEESVLSDSYSDYHSSAVDSSAMGSKQAATQSTDKEQKARATKSEKDGYKSGEKDHERNAIGREVQKEREPTWARSALRSLSSTQRLRWGL